MRITDLQTGDVVEIGYDKDISLHKITNKILIAKISNNKILAYWYDDKDLMGIPYQISSRQTIYKVLKHNVNVKDFLEYAEEHRNKKYSYKGYDVNNRKYDEGY